MTRRLTTENPESDPEYFSAAPPAVHALLRAAPTHVGSWANKTSLAVSERDKATRATWCADIGHWDWEQFVSVDASGTYTAVIRLYGWAPHDQ